MVMLNITNKIDRDYIQIKEWILIVGTCLAPMTGLRIWKVGPGEVLCIVYCILNMDIIKNIDKENIFFRFWMPFLGVSVLGTIWGTIWYSNETIIVGLFTWVYLGIISTGISCSLKRFSANYIQSIIIHIVDVSTILYSLLFIYSRYVSDTFLGAPLWYGKVRYTAGATNPHQIALMLSFSVIVLIWRIINECQIWYKIKCLIILIIAYSLMSYTQSSTAQMATVVAVTILVLCTIWNSMYDKRIMFILYYFLFGIFVLFFSGSFYKFVFSWIEEDSNGYGRIQLFRSFPIAFLKSPVIGLGPGTHASDGRMEFHNSYLEFLAMSGMVGFCIFLIFTIRLYRIVLQNTLSLSAISAGYMFGMSGFGARRLIYWVIVVLCVEMVEYGDVRGVVDEAKGFSKYIK